MIPKTVKLGITTNPTSLSTLPQTTHLVASKGVHVLVIPNLTIPPPSLHTSSSSSNPNPTPTQKLRETYLKLYNSAIELENPSGPGNETKESLERLAHETNIFLMVGVVERAGGRLFYTVLFIHPDTGIVGKRRGCVLSGIEKLFFSAGKPGDISPLTTKVNGIEVRISVGIGAENWVPLVRERLYEDGAEVYLVFGGSVLSDVDAGGFGNGSGGDITHEKEIWEALVRTVAVEGRVFGVGLWSVYCSGAGTEGGVIESKGGIGDGFGAVHTQQAHWKKRSRSITAEGPHEIVWPEVHPRDQDEKDGVVSPRIRRSITAEGPHEIVWLERHADEEMVSPKRKEEKKPVIGMGGGRVESAWMVSPFGEILASKDGDGDGDGLLVREIDLEDCIRARWDQDGGAIRDVFRLVVEGMQ